MYKALQSFTTKKYDIHRTQILEDDFTNQDEINEFLNIGYIVEYDGTIEITENGQYDVEDYETADVNVSGILDTSDATATAGDIVEGKTAYANGKKLIGTNTYNAKMNTINYGTSFKIVREIIELPLISITNVTNMQEAFSHCERITTIPLFDTKKVTNMSSAFEYCYNLKNIPQIDTGKVQNFSSMFSYCRNLESLPELNFESAINVSNFFAQVFNVINLGGFDNLGKAYIEKTINYARYALNLSSCEGLAHDSIMNVINNLYDLNQNENLSVDGVCQYTQSLVLGATNLTKLTDEEKAIAVSKGWTLS